VKRYSSGMQVRLGFAIATAVDSEVLIVDEVLAVGDLAFQRKCFDRIERLIRRDGRTVLIVSHNIRQIERLCTRATLLEHGRVAESGKPASVCNAFYERSDETIQRNRAGEVARIGRLETSNDMELLSIEVFDSSGRRTDTLTSLGSAVFEVVYRVHTPVPNPVFGLGFHTSDFVYLATQQSIDRLTVKLLEPGEYRLRFKLHRMPFLPGVYAVRLGVALGDSFQPVYYVENAIQLRVIDPDGNRAVLSAGGEGFVRLEGDWEIDGIEGYASTSSRTLTESGVLP
jgi:lipopolysaccharide transport system ATP-binding protein